MKTTPRFSSDKFAWKGAQGSASKSDLTNERMPLVFEVISEKSGAVKTFELDQNAPGYEDGWDGEYWCFTSNEWDSIKLLITND